MAKYITGNLEKIEGIHIYFVIKKASNGQYYFLIKSDNGEVVATSETYIFKESAERTIDSIKKFIDKNSIVIDSSTSVY